MIMASMFTMVYVIGPLSLPASILMMYCYPSSVFTWLIALPTITSLLYEPPQMPEVIEKMTPILDYFQYDECMELSNEEYKELLLKQRKTFIFACVPHGVFSFGSVCRNIFGPYEFKVLKVAVAPIGMTTLSD